MLFSSNRSALYCRFTLLRLPCWHKRHRKTAKGNTNSPTRKACQICLTYGALKYAECVKRASYLEFPRGQRAYTITDSARGASRFGGQEAMNGSPPVEPCLACEAVVEGVLVGEAPECNSGFNGGTDRRSARPRTYAYWFAEPYLWR
jgi:hypothetical protein